MKELEERITKIITKTIKLNILFDIKKHVSPDVAQEVKDIAIEFAEFIRLNATEIPDGWQVNGKIYTSKELLDKFIKQRYAAP